MKFDWSTFPNRQDYPRDLDYIHAIHEWVENHKAELREILENPNIYCNNCKDLSAENAIKKILGER